MEEKTLGKMIAALRKEKGMTQSALAEKMGVTDKAVSKWERDLSCPDIMLLPRLAETLGVTVDELLQAKVPQSGEKNKREEAEMIAGLVLKAVALAMGVAVTALSVIGQLAAEEAVAILGIGLACAALSLFAQEK